MAPGAACKAARDCRTLAAHHEQPCRLPEIGTPHRGWRSSKTRRFIARLRTIEAFGLRYGSHLDYRPQFIDLNGPLRRIASVILQSLVAIFASIVGLLSSLTTLVMLMAGMANAKPAHLEQGKWMMWGIVLMQVVALGAAIWLMVKHKPWVATVAGIFPLVAVVVLVVVLVKIEW